MATDKLVPIQDYFYDTEFLEQGPHKPIDLISIGVKRRIDGWRYYAISNEFNFAEAWNRRSPDGTFWLRENVLKKLPLHRNEKGEVTGLDLFNPAVKSLAEIRHDLELFFEIHLPHHRRLWAWYADYDHVVLSQIWGTMVQLPRGMPMFTHDLKQIVDMAGNPAMPADPEGAHNALVDAEHLELMWNYCRDVGLMPNLPLMEPDLSARSTPAIHVNRCRGDDCIGHDH